MIADPIRQKSIVSYQPEGVNSLCNPRLGTVVFVERRADGMDLALDIIENNRAMAVEPKLKRISVASVVKVWGPI